MASHPQHPPVCKIAGELVRLYSAGTCSITASQPGNGVIAAATSVTRSFTVSVAKPSGALTLASGLSLGFGGYSLAVGDFNRDGIPDFAVANFYNANITVLLGDGAGGINSATPQQFSTGTNPVSVAVGDFNADGIQDLAVANQGSNNVTVLLGNQSGGFAEAQGSPFATGPGQGPSSLVVGDFNGDGVQDLAGSGGAGVIVLLGNGTGGFTASSSTTTTVGPEIVAADFNGDGILDLAGSGGAGVIVLLGNGTGGFTASSSTTPAMGSQIVVADFNGDGILDLAGVNFDHVTVLLGNGSGKFTVNSGSPYAVSQYNSPLLTSLVAGDFNGDGFADLAVSGVGDPTINVLLGNGFPGLLHADTGFRFGNYVERFGWRGF